MKTRLRYYVGVIIDTHDREVFKWFEEPTFHTHGLKYSAVIGPFRTKRGAEYMADPVKGRDNPHCQSVADAERLAKKYQATGS